MRKYSQYFLILVIVTAALLRNRADAAGTNLALSGTGYRWYGLTSNAANINKVAASGVNDNNLTTDVPLTGSSTTDDAIGAYEAAGVIWSSPQTVTSVNYINGTFDANSNGVFTGNLVLQFTTNGTTWTNSGWNFMPTYAYDTSAASKITYTFSGNTISVLGIRAVGQVHTSDNNNSWHANAYEVQAFGPTILTTTNTPTSTSMSVSTNTPTFVPPTVTSTNTLMSTSTSTPTNNPTFVSPTATSTNTPTTPSGNTNLAPSGMGYRWYGLTSSTANTNKVTASGINDNNLTIDVPLTGSTTTDDAVGTYEAAGVMWSSSQTITSINYINGTFDASSNGVFTASLSLQFTTDGITWMNSGWSFTPSYAYDTAAAAKKTYVFTGSAIAVLGVRAIGQVHTSDNNNSWHANAYEVQAYGSASAPNTTSTSTSTPTNTPTATTTPTSGGTWSIVSQTQFNSWFPNPNALYTYANFVTAIASYPSFANSGNSTQDKREAAAFFAHVAHETSYLFYTDEQNYTPGYYCGTWTTAQIYGCASGQDYHGRGPLQISWNYNYKMASTSNYWNDATSKWVSMGTPSVGADVWANPSLVSIDGVITWKTALWFWVTHGLDANTPSATPHTAITAGNGFGQTIQLINGGLECGQPSGSYAYNEMIDRGNIYTTFLSNLGVSDSRTKTC